MAHDAVVWWSTAAPSTEPDFSSPTRRPQLAEIQHRELVRLLRALVALRLALAPLIGLLAVLVAMVDDSPWRRLTVGAVALLLFGLSWFEAVRFRLHGLQPWTLPANVVVMALFQGVVIAVTGALDSPLLPAMIPIAMVSVMLIPDRSRLWAPGLQIALVVAFAGVQLLDLAPWLYLPALGGPPEDGPQVVRLVSVATVMLAILTAVTALGTRVRVAFDVMVGEALDSRAALLEAHAEQARQLRALSGEIAHELKNPLASIKGLSALVARDLTEGRSAERLGVLRTEVDRMQAILDELLNFTRPLVPLAVKHTHLGELCREVAALHEGQARDRGVSLRVEAEPDVAVACDPRKVHQVLLNLLQNALAASPRGGVVRLQVRAVDGGAEVVVQDQGPGLPAELRDSAFEPGVTGRPDGSGLGLTIARSLARQHGGELELESGPGGCTAVVTLPGEVVE